MPDQRDTKSPSDALLSVRGVKKAFGATEVLKGIDFGVARGEVHGLLGPNGAGKSTVIKILAGIERADAGEIIIDGLPLARGREKIGVIHQDLGLVDALTVRENLLLTTPRTRFAGLIAARRERVEAERSLNQVGLDLHPDTPLAELGLGEKSLIAVARLLSFESQLLILDEITAALTHSESQFVLGRVREIASGGASVIVVTHRLREVTDFADAVTFIEDGKIGFSGPTPSPADLRHLFTSRSEEYIPPTRPEAADERPTLVSLKGARGGGVGPVDLEIKGGEVFGLVGTLASNLFGIGHLVAGQVACTDGKREVKDREGGPGGRVAFVPEDRRTQGMLTNLDVAFNATISSLAEISRFGMIVPSKEHAAVGRTIEELDVRPKDPSIRIDSLSGGNAQKVIVGRAAMSDPDVYVLCEPTRGVDVATREAIYDFVAQVSNEGAAVLVITIDPEDALQMSHRIGVAESGSIGRNELAVEMTLAKVLEEI